jgi:peptide chain release factor subunit 1
MPASNLISQLDRLSSLAPGPFPIVSLYLDMQPDQHGRDNFEPYLRKELGERIGTYPASGPERESLEADRERILAYVGQVDPSVNGLAVFASSGADLFEAVTLATPIDRHRLFISDQPHLYPLAHLVDRYPRFVVLVADTRQARLLVVAANIVEQATAVEGTKTRRHKMGGWSQARYQRHIDNYHLHHAKEVADALARVVREEGITSILLAGDEVILPLLRDQFSKEIADKVVDTLKLDIRAPEHEVLRAATDALQLHDARDDRARVEALLDEYRAGGLATVGIEATRRALELGQVDELVVGGVPDAIDAEERLADEFVIKARQTSARISFVEDATLLAAAGGVGAFLRFRI